MHGLSDFESHIALALCTYIDGASPARRLCIDEGKRRILALEPQNLDRWMGLWLGGSMGWWVHRWVDARVHRY